MKTTISIALITLGLTLPAPAVAKQHFWDRLTDSDHWQQRPVNADCPGPTFKSIWFKDHGSSVMRTCVDPRSVVRLPNGDSRARFVRVSYHGENSRVVGGKHFTTYRSQYKVLNCKTARWNTDQGYSVQNKASDSYVPVEGKPGWFIFAWEGKIPTRLKSLNTEYGGIQLTSVGPDALFLCPNIQG